MKKQVIRLTEEDLHNIISESVKRYLNEMDYGTVSNNQVGKSGKERALMFQKFEKQLMNNEEVMFNIPLNNFNVFSVEITPISNSNVTLYDVQTSLSSKRCVSPREALSFVEQNYQTALSQISESQNYSNQLSFLNEAINNQDYTHFAVNKSTNKIVNGWDYNGYEPSELRSFKKDYFDSDLIDYGLNPKEYKILTLNRLIKMGIDPNNDENWTNS